MSSNFEDVLYLFSCGALGKEPSVKHNINFDEVYKISLKQGIWGVVFLSIKKLYENGKVNIEKDSFELWEKEFFARAVKQLKKRGIIAEVLLDMKQNGISSYLLKGDIVAQYYNEPLSRVSSDTDIYVGENKINEAEKIFEKHGFKVCFRSPLEHHTVCKHTVAGDVDLHVTFHDECFEKNYFKGYTEVKEKGIEYQIDNYKYISLGATDNAIFLFLHWVKHFLSCGTGIRQIMDFFVFWKNNSQYINKEEFSKMLVDLGFSKLYAASVNVCLKYLQFDEAEIDTFDFEVDEFFVSWLLTDIEQGGVFGKLERRKLTIQYLFGNNRVSEIGQNTVFQYMKLYFNTFKYDTLSRKYHYLANNKILLPIAYLNRMFDIMISAIRVLKVMRSSSDKNYEYREIDNRIKIIMSFYEKK